MSGEPRPSAPILVVDDDPHCRAVVAGVLRRAGYAVCEATTGEEAVTAALGDPPMLAVIDICLPGISGYEVFHRLRTYLRDLPVVFMSAVRTESYDRVAGLLLGADDYLVKPFAPDELVLRVRRLLKGLEAATPAANGKLTRRELEVLRLLADGLAQDEIATRLVISRKTVGTHIEHILRKVGARSRAQAVMLAYRQRLLESAA